MSRSGPSDRHFPDTRPSVVRDTLAEDPSARARALDALARQYWTPICSFVQLRWGLDEDTARDMTQEFFAQALERGLFHRYDPARSRLRTYLRVCVDSFVRNEWKTQGRLKRGGRDSHVDVDLVPDLASEDEVAAAERAFEREWMRALFSSAIQALQHECAMNGRHLHFALLHRYDIEEADAPRRSTYTELAVAYDLPVTQVTNFLAWARRRLRVLVLDALRAQCGTDEEFRAEVRSTFGVRT